MVKSYSRFFLRCVFARGLLLLIVGAIALASSTAFAKTVTQLCVNKSGTNGCSTTIQGAVGMVPAGGSAIITIAAGKFDEHVTVSNATVSFVGKGPGMTIVDGTNGSNFPTFNFEMPSNGELHNLTIESGSGITGSNVEFVQKNMMNKGVGTLKIANCEITGGGSYSNFHPAGAVRFFGKTLIIDSTSIRDNIDKGLSIGNGHAFITNTTITGNTATGSGGFASGCGIHAFNSSVALDNVTITNNACVGNDKSEGGGIWVDVSAKLSMANSVIFGNTVSLPFGGMPLGPDCFSSGTGLKSMGYNLITDHTACTFTPAKTDLAEGTDPRLSSLATCASSALEVQKPMAGSPLIGKGNPRTPTGKAGSSSSSCLPTDECGSARATGTCDIGAVQ